MSTALSLAAIVALVVVTFAALPSIIASLYVVPYWLRYRRVESLPPLPRLLQIGRTVAPAGPAFEAVVVAEVAGLDLDTDWPLGHLLAGGDPSRVVMALAAARAQGHDVDIATLAALDLAGHDPVEATERGDYHPDIPHGPLRDALREAGLPGLGAA